MKNLLANEQEKMVTLLSDDPEIIRSLLDEPNADVNRQNCIGGYTSLMFLCSPSSKYSEYVVETIKFLFFG